jgi:hypothetical protein
MQRLRLLCYACLLLLLLLLLLHDEKVANRA